MELTQGQAACSPFGRILAVSFHPAIDRTVSVDVVYAKESHAKSAVMQLKYVFLYFSSGS